MNIDIIDKIEVNLLKDFPVVRETLSRMGIKNSNKKLFFPSCYCVSKDNKYYIVHFKELFKAYGGTSTYDEIDSLRTKTISFFLQKWGIVEVEDDIDSILKEKIHILKRVEKDEYTIIHKFRFPKTNDTKQIKDM